jgi:hypothetical protein
MYEKSYIEGNIILNTKKIIKKIPIFEVKSLAL